MYGTAPFIPTQANVALSTSTNQTSTVSQQPFEAAQSEYAINHMYSVVLTSPSGLTMTLNLQMFDKNTNTWVNMPQEVCVLAQGAAPNVQDGNAAAAAAVVGNQVRNNNGLTNIQNTLTVLLTARGLGTRVRLNPQVSAGTVTAAFAYYGPQVFS